MKGGPIGNQYAKGNKGGRRKSAYLEHQDAEWHAHVWNSAQDVEKLRMAVEGAKFVSGRDIAAYKLLVEKNERVVIKFMDKLVPDLVDVTSKGQSVVFQISETVARKNGLIEDNDINTSSKSNSG